MPSRFLLQLQREADLSSGEMTLLSAADVRSYSDLDSLTRSFPSIVELGVRLPHLSNIAARQVTATYSAIASQTLMLIQVKGGRAEPPSGTSWPVGARVPLSSQSGGSGPPPTPPPARLDLRMPQWAVRDQGQRGTCVAFGTTACFEHRRAGLNPPPTDFSEQFLYWAIKTTTSDPRPMQDGTSLQFARDAISQTGICEEALWPYSGVPLPNITGAGTNIPSANATANAKANAIAPTSYRQAPGAGAVLSALQQGRPVAISLPVFQDPIFPTGPTNWTTPSGWSYGRVLNPIPRSVVVGGHAVCVVGYEPDPDEPQGGYFIVRNSWGPIWASQAPSAGNSYSPEPGYGEIAASYVDAFLWELLDL